MKNEKTQQVVLTARQRALIITAIELAIDTYRTSIEEVAAAEAEVLKSYEHEYRELLAYFPR